MAFIQIPPYNTWRAIRINRIRMTTEIKVKVTSSNPSSVRQIMNVYMRWLFESVNLRTHIVCSEIIVLVYCKECGTNNDDTAVNCSNCGESLSTQIRSPRRAGRNECFGSSRQEGQNECFGLPQGGTIVGIIIGILIILAGIQSLMDWNFDLGPYMIILVGILIAAGAFYQMNKSKR